MDPIGLLRERAKKKLRTVVLPEGDDPRVLEAGITAANEGYANIIVLGGRAKIEKDAAQRGAPKKNFAILDPKTANDADAVINAYYEKRKAKGVTLDGARKLLLENYIFYGAMMAALGKADSFVAGAAHATSDVARAAIHCFAVDKEIGCASGSFVIYVKGSRYGEAGLFLFADCGLMPDPNARQLAGIAVASARLFKKLYDIEPYVAMLSYSTKSSAEGPLVAKVQQAVVEAKRIAPDLAVDGELQVDSALDIEVAKIKKSVQGSPVAGKANVLIFPNLDSGNIAYKIIQRLAGARAIGPLIQGLTKPCSDLSRGCTAEDMVDAICVMAILSH